MGKDLPIDTGQGAAQMGSLYGMCLTCREQEAVCDDNCIACEVQFLCENPDEYEPGYITTLEGGKKVHLWSQPFWREVAHQFEQTPEWQAECDRALAMYEAMAARVAA